MIPSCVESVAVPAASAAPWYALRTRSRHEKLVHARLTSLGVETFLPLQRRVQRWSDRKRLIELPLFPGYLFLRGDALQRERAAWTPGAVGYAGTDRAPGVVAADELDAVRAVIARLVPFDPYPGLLCGQRVRVTAGPLRGVVGTLVERGRHYRLQIAIQAIGRSILAEVDATDVEPD
ncbi:MAG: UpxY family transcription antiterminator [Planctomycetota bacterium]